jgi:hypothetical protein
MITKRKSKFENEEKFSICDNENKSFNLIKISSINAFVKFSAFHVFFDEIYKLNLI